MALQINYTDPATKVVLGTCYARILNIMIDAVGQTVTIQIGLYPTAAARTAGGTPLFYLNANPPFAPVIAGPIDIQVACYNYLKTLVTFTGAADV